MKFLCASRLQTVLLLLIASGLIYLLVTFLSIDGSWRYFNGSWTRLAVNAKETTLNTSTSCRPINHIYYLKTHKTASSTFGSILVGYGFNRNLTFVLSESKAKQTFNWPKRFHLSSGSPLYNEMPNMIYSHMRFNKEPINWLFPKPKSKYVTIIRNPVDNFNSAFAFFGLKSKFKLTSDSDPVETFLESPGSYQDAMHAGQHYQLILHVRNPMIFDMGLDHEYFRNLTAVDSYIRFLDKEFDLVLITDHFDESLVLLKRLLCWEFDDIVYKKLRVRAKPKLKEEVRRKILAWNRADALLFDHFNKTLWKKILDAGPQFAEDLQTFRKLNQYYEDACSSKTSGKVEKELSKKCAQMKKFPDHYRYDIQTINSRRREAETIHNKKDPEVPADSLDY